MQIDDFNDSVKSKLGRQLQSLKTLTEKNTRRETANAVPWDDA